MPWVVGVQASGNQGPPAERPVVGMHARLTARLAVPVLLVGAHAARVTDKDSRTEALLVLLTVAPLPGRPSPLLRLAPVALAPAATLGVLGAPGDGAHPVSPTSGHGRLRIGTVSGLGGGEREG